MYFVTIQHYFYGNILFGNRKSVRFLFIHPPVRVVLSAALPLSSSPSVVPSSPVEFEGDLAIDAAVTTLVMFVVIVENHNLVAKEMCRFSSRVCD